jgi:hypothetical protein
MSDEDREEASGGASSTSSPYTADGPGFDEKAPVGQPPADEAEVEAFAELWQVEQVRDWLTNAGALAHAGFGVGEHDWEFTKADLARIAPPATRILNRYQPSRVAAAYSDPAAVAIGFGLYGWRSTLERVAVMKAHKRQEGAAPPTSAPAAEPERQPAGDSGDDGPATPGPTWAEQLQQQRQAHQEEETG